MVKMFKFLGPYLSIQTSLGYNQLIYWMSQVPFLGKEVPNAWYGINGAKKIVYFIQLLLALIKKVGLKLFYFLGVFLLSLFVFLLLELDPESLTNLFLGILSIFTIFGGIFNWSTLLDPTSQLEVISIKMLKIEAKIFYQTKLLVNSFSFLILDGIIHGLLAWVLLSNFWFGLSMAVFALGLRNIFTLFFLPLYRPNANQPSSAIVFLNLVAWIGIPILTFITIINVNRFPLEWVYNWQVGFIGVVLLILTAFIFHKATFLNRLAKQVITYNTLSNVSDVNPHVKGAGVEVKAKNYQVDTRNQEDTNLFGISYLNDLFFKRLGSVLNKKVYQRVAIIGGVFAIAITLLLVLEVEIRQEQTEEFFLMSVPIFTIPIAYYAYMGEQFTKFCFYNLDRTLMHYTFYRQPDIVLTSIKNRFLKSVQYNAPILFTFLVGSTTAYFIFGGQAFFPLVISLGAQVLMMLLFSMHHLFLYYLIQPFTESMQTKSPLYNIINGLMFFVIYFIYLDQGETFSQILSYVFYGGAIIYLPLGLFLVYRYAPNTFKLRK